jgi:sulfite reductase alpha subunit-like flavoprotein
MSVTTSFGQSPLSPAISNTFSDTSSSDSAPSTPATDVPSDDSEVDDRPVSRKRRASTMLVSQNSEDVRRLLGEQVTAEMIKNCCGGGCCMREIKPRPYTGKDAVTFPPNRAFKSLEIKFVDRLGLEAKFTDIVDLPQHTVSFDTPKPSYSTESTSTVYTHPPKFVTPHPPYEVFSAPLFHARELTKPGAEKRTFHFDLDVTDYPAESGDVDFVVGGAIGVCAPNSTELVDQVFDLLGVPKFVRDKTILMKTSNGRWPTIWGDEQARELLTTRRELLTWCSDLQSYPPTKQLFRLLAEYAEDESERKILLFLSSSEGQAAFCDLRTGPYITLVQLLSAFPSSRPPLDHLLTVLNQLMPRFYSLSQDPQVSCHRDGTNSRRLIEIAVTVHDTDDWSGGKRTGLGSGFLERLAQQFIDAEAAGMNPHDLDLRVPMFRGLMANPLAREFVSDGPMLLIGAGVGIAPFRGFVHRRLKSANCANKVWVLQGVRDSLLDELYSGDWGVEESKVKKVVQSRRGESKYVQHEVRAQADLVWFVINALDGRIFVCGSTKGMGEGVEKALIDISMAKGTLNHEEAKAFWEKKKADGQYIAETW